MKQLPLACLLGICLITFGCIVAPPHHHGHHHPHGHYGHHHAPVCENSFCIPRSPDHYSEPMHPALTTSGQPYLIPQSGLRTLMQQQAPHE